MWNQCDIQKSNLWAKSTQQDKLNQHASRNLPPKCSFFSHFCLGWKISGAMAVFLEVCHSLPMYFLAFFGLKISTLAPLMCFLGLQKQDLRFFYCKQQSKENGLPQWTLAYENRSDRSETEFGSSLVHCQT